MAHGTGARYDFKTRFVCSVPSVTNFSPFLSFSPFTLVLPISLSLPQPSTPLPPKIGTSPARSLAVLQNNAAPGTFVIRTEPAPGAGSSAPATHDKLLLTYVGADGRQNERTISPSGDGGLRLEGVDSAYAHVEDVLVDCMRNAAPLGVRLRLPALGGRPLQVHSPSIMRHGNNAKEEPWNYWQLGKSEDEALAVLSNKKSGAFVLRDNPRKSGGLILSYKFQRQVIDEPVSHTPASTMFTQGYCLDREQNAVFKDIHQLVDNYCRGNTTLKCALRVSQRPPRGLQPPGGAPARSQRASARGSTFADLAATAERGPEDLSQWHSPGTRRKQFLDSV